jgi:SagB-type dehydrogenase family enzyme
MARRSALPDSLRLIWREGVSALADGEGTLVVQGPAVRVSFQKLPRAILDALGRFDPPGEEADRLRELIGSDGNGDLARWYYCLERLTRLGLLCHVACARGTRLATLVAVSHHFVSRPGRVTAGSRYVLSRFAYMHRQGTQAVLESPLAHARIILNDYRVAALVAALAAPATAAELAERFAASPPTPVTRRGEGSHERGGALPAEAVVGVLVLLLQAGMLDEADKEDAPALQTWELHDLLFHARSRPGRFDAPHGGTYRLADRLPPPPALKPAMAGDAHELYRPDLDRLEQDDPPLARVQATRRSIREFDRALPITARQLGEFLFRVARVTATSEGEVTTPCGPVRLQFTARPYPAGGGLYELELYAVIQSCTDLAAGLYHYDPAGHRLIRLRGSTAEVTALLSDAAGSTGVPEETVQVLLIVAARFARIAWKYESIAYALTLKHVGVVYQTMYLAATAMGLAPCAIGGGDADLFARATGIDYCTETSVGEFLLGSRRLESSDRVFLNEGIG